MANAGTCLFIVKRPTRQSHIVSHRDRALHVHAHRLLRYSLRCIVEMRKQIYTLEAVNLSARCPQAVLAL
jgi:hypothetical protein